MVRAAAPPIEVKELGGMRHEKAVRRHLLRTELLMQRLAVYPPALRKSGIPDSVDMPAPPKKTARRLALRISLSVSISVIVNLPA